MNSVFKKVSNHKNLKLVVKCANKINFIEVSVRLEQQKSLALNQSLLMVFSDYYARGRLFLYICSK